MRFFREKRLFAKITLWIIVGMLAVGLIATSVSWYFGSGYQDSAPTPSQQADPGEVALSEEEELQQLVGQYKTMAEEKPEDVAISIGYARVAKELGFLYLEKDSQEQGELYLRLSVENYEKVLAEQQDTNLYLELAEAYQLLNELEEAKEIIDAVLVQEPELLEARIQKGLLLEAEEDWETALKLWSDLAQEENDSQVRSFAESRKEAVEEQLKD